MLAGSSRIRVVALIRSRRRGGICGFCGASSGWAGTTGRRLGGCSGLNLIHLLRRRQRLTIVIVADIGLQFVRIRRADIGFQFIRVRLSGGGRWSGIGGCRIRNCNRSGICCRSRSIRTGSRLIGSRCTLHRLDGNRVAIRCASSPQCGPCGGLHHLSCTHRRGIDQRRLTNFRRLSHARMFLERAHDFRELTLFLPAILFRLVLRDGSLGSSRHRLM